jgi:guanylate kinase
MSKASNNAPGLLLVISGPSGVGKTTITHEVERRLGGIFSVSITTRPKTTADVEGRDYYFINDQEFDRHIRNNDLLEWAEVFGKYKYGTLSRPVEEALAKGQLMILEIDVQGALQVKSKLSDALMLFIEPPTDKALLERLRRRGRDTPEAIDRRFAEAKREIETARQSGAYDHFIVNDVLEESIDLACDLVQRRRNSAFNKR